MKLINLDIYLNDEITLTNIKPVLNELKRELQEIYGDRLAYITLYGSQARNEATPDSDIDILVVLHGNRPPAKVE